MGSGDLIEPFAVQEFFVDGFDGFHVLGGTLRCTGYKLQPLNQTNGDPLKVAVVKLVVPYGGASEAAHRTEAALSGLSIFCERKGVGLKGIH